MNDENRKADDPLAETRITDEDSCRNHYKTYFDRDDYVWEKNKCKTPVDVCSRRSLWSHGSCSNDENLNTVDMIDTEAGCGGNTRTFSTKGRGGKDVPYAGI